MRKFYSFLLFIVSAIVTHAQDSVCTSHNFSNGAGSITFNVRNNSANPIMITDVKTAMNSGLSGTYSYQLLYNTTPINQPSTPWTGGTVGVGQNGWQLAGSSSGVVVPTHTAPVTVMSGLTLVIPSGATYTLGLSSSGTLGYQTLTIGAGVNNFTSNGVSIQTGDAISWGGGSYPATPVNYPRGWDGCLKWVALPPCAGTPVAGTAVSSVVNPCPNSNFTLSLNGATIASGITYQWQSSTNNTTWTNMTGATTAAVTTSQTASMYYRAIVSCGASSDTSASVQVTSPANLAAGTYTINAALPASSTNFQSFGAAVAAMNCGIAGPVVFNVAPGTYNEQVIIPEIINSSSVNTIRFNGNGATLMSSPSSSTSRSGITLNGADFVTIDSLNVNVAGGTYGWGILLTNTADSNKITNNTITTNITSTSTNYIGIMINGSVSSASSSGNNGNGNLISGNTVNGGYYGIFNYGSTSPYNQGNMIVENVVKDFYLYGIYNYGNDNLLVSKNDISRPTRTTGITTTYGVYVSTNSDVKVEKNRVHDVYAAIASPTTSTVYGLYMADDGTTTELNHLQNNAVYNIKKTNGTVYGIYIPNYDYWKVYHNTIILDDAASTAGTTQAIYAYGTGVEVKNNIGFITRGGTGEKHVLNYPTTTATLIPTSNNNVLYINAPAGNNYIGQLGTTDYATLANWQAANSGTMDLLSVSVNPLFANVLIGNLYPNNTSFANIGAAVGVATDIIEFARNATSPTPGAYEIVPATGTDMGATALVSPIQKQCYSNAETVNVTIKNYSANTHNFAATPVTVNVSVTGPNATIFTPVVVNTGTLASNATLNVLISSTYNMSAGGTYVFNASTSATGDANANNNAMPAVSLIDTTLAAGTINSNPPSYCVTGGTPTLTLANGGGGAIQWQESPTGLAGSWVNVGTNNTTYTPSSAITATMHYRAYRTCGGNGDTSVVKTVAVNNPQILSTTPATRCGPGTATISATGSAGATFNWYTAATGGAPVFTGASYTTPILTANTTYYVAASSGGGGLQSVGAPNLSIGSAAVVGTYYMEFTVLVPTTIQSVNAYFNTVGSPFVLNIRNASTLASVFSFPGTTTVSGTTTPQTIPINATLPPGNYQMGWTTDPGTYRVSSGASYPYTIPGVISITGNTFNDPNYYYYFFNWQVLTGCESARQAVSVTVNTPPTFDITSDVTVCNNEIIALSPTTPLSNFNNYTWSPAAGLYTNAAATTAYTAGTNASTVYARIATPGTYNFIATANNTSTSCQNIDSVKVTVLPAAVSVIASPDELCVSGTTSLSLSPNPSTFGTATYQWLSSTNNTTYAPISGATNSTYSTPTINTTTYYKIDIKNSAGQVCLSPYDTVKVNSPQILSTTPAALCNPGTMTLGATANTGSTINWYTAATGGSLVGTGTSFTTPSLSSTTTYYAAAMQGGGGVDVGVKVAEFPICGAPVTSSATGYSLRFTTTKAVVINSAWIIPAATNVTVALRAQGSSTNIVSQSFTFTTAQVGTPQQINLGWPISSTGNYQLVNVTGGLWRITTLGCGYPFTTPGGGFSITGSATSSTGTPNTTTYNGFFQINVTEGCESPRVAVTAQVSSVTSITSNPLGNISTCVGSTITLAVGADGANLTYQWRKNGVVIANSNNDTLIITPVALGDAGTYDVVITGLCGPAVTSGVSIVNVSAANTWLGKVSPDWHDVNNWCGGIPTSTTDVVIFPGTPYQPVISAGADVKTLTLNTGAVVIVSPGDTLNIYGNFVNSGTFSAANGTIYFKGTSLQNVDELVASSIHINGAGVSLNGNMTANQNVTMTAGNLTLGISNLSTGTIQGGSPSSQIVSNSTGSVIVKNVGATAVVVPVGPSASSFNPVTIANGGGRDYSVRVSTGLSPTVANPSRAVNRTWTISPNLAPASAATITFQYADAHMNTPGVPTNPMEVGVHNGTAWTVVTPNVTPTGTATARQVITTTNQFGSMAVSNIGGISWITAVPSVDASIASMQLLPNIVETNALLRIISSRAAKVQLNVVDANGRIVLSFDKQVMTGQNDMTLQLGKLAAGSYNITGTTDKGKTQVVRFVKL